MSLNKIYEKICVDSSLIEHYKSICFLRLKIENSKDKLLEEYPKFKQEMVKRSEKDLKKDLIFNPLQKDYSSEETRNYEYKNVESENNLFFYLDTIIIDIKREIEFSFKFLAKSLQIEIGKFSLENIIDQITNKKGCNPSAFIKKITEKYPDYIKFLIEKVPWLMQLNTKRTRLIHEGIINQPDKFIVGFYWGVNEDKYDKPKAILPQIDIFGHPIDKWTEYQLKELDFFITETLGLRKDLFKTDKQTKF